MIPITWKTTMPVWIPQWPLSKEKLEAASQLVEEQLQLGHLEPSQSPWNTPIFVIKKKSGKWRLLHDLRAINQQMQVMGPIQRGLPALTAIPQGWPVIAVDIKDCFFSIPLNKKDKERFAFTLPSINHERPDKRYQWVVLPQGMANSPTMCQLYVDTALQPVREKFPDVKIIHYMDDVLLSAPSMTLLEQVLGDLSMNLETRGLYLAPEKIQKGDSISFLGAVINKTTIIPQKIEIRTNHLTTLNDFQKLLGDINWLRPYLSLTRFELQPLFAVLEGNPDLNSPRQMTPEAQTTLQKVEQALMKAQLQRYNNALSIWMCVLPTLGFPTGVLWQDGPLLWIHTKSLGMKTLSHYPSMVAEVAFLGIKQCVSAFAMLPEKLVVPYSKDQIEILTATTSEWSILMYTFSGIIDNHLPKNEILKFIIQQPVIFPRVTVERPLNDALTIYTDGSKSGKGAYMVQGQHPVVIDYRPDAPQVVECHVVLEVFQRFQEPFNLISDSLYVVNAVKHLEVTPHIRSSSTVASLLAGIRFQILRRQHPFYVTHIRAHSLLPGPMAKANEQVDMATRVFLSLDQKQQAQEFHELYHVSSAVLRKKFFITRAEARHIVKSCSTCAQFLPAQKTGVNPRGLSPNELWQMDVTHVPSFGKLQYVHVSVDTYSRVVHATPLSGERVQHVITHCLEAWAAWGKPAKLKTDNGPAYSSKSFALFCQKMQIEHVTGLPYNPQGQGIIERTNRTLKELLLKQKGGIAENCTPKQKLSLALFTLNFLNLHDEKETSAERHTIHEQKEHGIVMWKDVLTNRWKGPDRVVARSRGSLCVFPQDQDPIWVPTRLTRVVEEDPKGDAGRSRDDAELDGVDEPFPTQGGGQDVLGN